MTNKFVSPWVVVISLLRSGRLLSVANQSSFPFSESYLDDDKKLKFGAEERKRVGGLMTEKITSLRSQGGVRNLTAHPSTADVPSHHEQQQGKRCYTPQ
jgi:hypothetical protein